MADMSLPTGQPVKSQRGQENRSYRAARVWRYVWRNPPLACGLLLLVSLLLFAVVGAAVYDLGKAAPLSAPPAREPSCPYPLWTDPQGPDMLAALIAGSPPPPWLSLIARTIP